MERSNKEKPYKSLILRAFADFLNLFCGEKDDRTPAWMSEKIMKELPGKCELWIAPEADHGGANGPMKNFSQYNKKILDFLDKYLQGNTQ